MMKRLALCIAVAAAMSAPAFALDVPRSSKYDSRIRYVDYNDGDVTLVNVSRGLGTRIMFAPGEYVLDMGTGFNAGWTLEDSDYVLHVKPKSVKLNSDGSGGGQQWMSPANDLWDTNLMVRTNLRVYDFDLVLLKSEDDQSAVKQSKNATYRLQFRYPVEELADARAKAEKQRADAKMTAKPAPMNWTYAMQVGEKSSGIAPSMAYDDGRFTYLRFPNNRSMPAPFLVAEDGAESIPNHHVDPSQPDVLVIHRVVPEMGLRLGEMVVGVYNEHYDPDGIPAVGGTTVPGVKRVIKDQEAAQ